MRSDMDELREAQEESAGRRERFARMGRGVRERHQIPPAADQVNC